MVFRLWRIPAIILRFHCFLLFKPRRDPSAGSGRVRRGYGDAEVAAAVKRWKAGEKGKNHAVGISTWIDRMYRIS